MATAHRGRALDLDSTAMTGSILYLTADDVLSAMPPVAERLALAERTMTALVADAELPPKIGVHPRPEGSFAHAMPAALRPSAVGADTGADLLGIKWVAGFPEQPRSGLPAIHAVVVLSDPTTGEPRAILDGGPITAAADRGRVRRGDRAVRPAGDRSPARAAIVGAGVQGRSHLEVLGYDAARRAADDRRPPRGAGGGPGRGRAGPRPGSGPRRSPPTNRPRRARPMSS